MQFKHPELLYALLLLIIPIIIHLFQLRKFQKVEFTNVQFLKDIVTQTRKSSQLKKWLTLLTRMLLLACIVFAFAQPYFSNSDSFNTKSETVIYLDNSFSMQAKGSNGTLLNKAVQDIIESIDENENISIFTNDISFSNTNIKAIKNDLIQLSYAPNQLDYDAVLLKGKKAFSKDKSTLKNLVLISDFQQQNKPFNITNDSLVNIKLVPLKPTNTSNINIDSVYISKTNAKTLELTVAIKNQGNFIETLPVSLFNNDNLIAKSSVAIKKDTATTFTIPINEVFNGKVTIDDVNLLYDNTTYFNVNEREKIKVLSINESDDTFLKKIYTDDEFTYTSSQFNSLNYNIISEQNLIVLNELNSIPNALITALKSFTNDGGIILTIPSDKSNLDTYNQFYINYNLPNIEALNLQEKKITNINFSHPILANVFDKKVTNFQYPKVNTYYPFTTTLGATILSFEDGTSFLTQSNSVYSFSAALNDKNSNFKNSPLIVPILYNIGKQSLKHSNLYYVVNEENTIDIVTKLQQDDILTLVNSNNSVIPLQQTYTNKVELITNTYPKKAGIISVKNKNIELKKLSYNYNRRESELNYLDTSLIGNSTVNESIVSTINDIKSATNVNELWKWFVIFALAFLIIELLLLKFLK
ncbi:BatA domain-containing protein [Ichthyenterobacterium magnum]|uniref:Putative membrane protein (TIGR02226 family) n=1 Tax=Ichthyenterobacterium magnum TaxID=1230530 RepID=A0A420DM33_9FLAO|nr:BatA domain-containing protein [Ichthyenterobacterium magnum]RKE95258.1 putative membrane protein (TIGR02226 family) [Ichthyenterobacterium magnum]